MDSSKVDIFIENKNGKTYLIESPKSISLSNFKTLLINKKISIARDFFMIFRGKKYDKSNMSMIFNFEDSDKIELGDYRNEEALYVKMNPNVEINDGNMNFVDSINDDTSFKERESDVNENIIEPLLV